jgi:predicted O-linked N-acetylglucosamine transferase (SPINDLY family)
MLIPPESRKFYSEKVIYLPHSYQVNDNTQRIADGSPSRKDAGLPETGFVFCCFNNNYKIGPAEFDIWMRLLQIVEGSVLWLFKANPSAKNNLEKEAHKRSIDPGRLVFAERLPLPEHLARHRLADLFLDTFNYNAHTTASDALWAGLPVLTKLGEGFAARVAGSLLNAIDLPELITTTEEAYESLALELATNPHKLQSIKQKLLANRDTKPLFDTALFTRNLEEAYRRIHDLYNAGTKPEHIVIDNRAGCLAS